VQVVYPPQYTHGTSASTTLTQTAGNTLVVAAMQQLAGTSVTVTDTLDSTWQALTPYDNGSCGMNDGYYSAAQIWYANDIAAGSNTVTVTVNGGSTYVWLTVIEYAGVNPTAAVQSTGTVASTSSTSMSAGSVTTTAAASLVVGVFHDATQGQPMSAGLGFANIADEQDLVAIVEDNLDVPPGGIAPTASLANADSCWVATAAAFGAK